MASTKKALKFSQLRVGIFVLFGLAVLGFLIMNSSGDFNPFEKKIKLKARFAAADGLREGSEVLLAGVHIGKVEKVFLLPPDSPEEFKIEAIMSVQRELDGRLVSDRIRSDSTAQLVATSLLANDKMINISPGTAKGSSITEGQVLESKDAMSINQLTQTGNDLLQQINKLAVPANEILNKANNGQGTLGKVVNDPSLYKNLDETVAEARATMTRLQATIDKVNSGQGSAGKLLNDPALYNSLNKTVAQLESISNDIRSGRGTAGKFVNDDALYNETRAAIADLRVSASKINEIADDFKVISSDLREGKGSAGKLLKDEKLYDDTKALVAKLDAMVDDARGGKGTVGKLITDETLYNNINQTAANINQFSSEGTKLLYDFRQNPKKFLRIKLSIF